LSETEGLPVEAASLGTLDLGAEPALPEALAVAERLGLDLSAHRARSVAEVDLAPYDLVLGFERKHVVASVVEARAQIERTFTVPELVGLFALLPGPPLSRDAAERARARIRQAHAERPADFRNAPLPELRDPLGLTPQAQREVALQLEEQVSKLAEQLFD
jgi:protein-tyrosine-phosphatase